MVLNKYLAIILLLFSCNNFAEKDKNEFNDVINQEFVFGLVEEINFLCYSGVNEANLNSKLKNDLIENVIIINNSRDSLEYIVFLKEIDDIDLSNTDLKLVNLIYYKNKETYTYNTHKEYFFNR